MTAPQTTKRVGAGGCLLSIAVFVLSIVAFVGLIVWGVVGVVNDLQKSPAVALGSTTTVTISNTGTQFLFLGNFDSGGTLPSVNPSVSITDPSGNDVAVTGTSTTSSGTSTSGEFRSVGQFNATTAGSYTVTVGETLATGSARGAKVYITNIDAAAVGTKILLAVAVGGLLFVLSIVLAIVWLVRRSRSNKPPIPPYQGGAPAYPGGAPYAGGSPGYPPAGAPSATPPVTPAVQPPASPPGWGGAPGTQPPTNQPPPGYQPPPGNQPPAAP